MRFEQKTIQVYIGGKHLNLDQLNEHLADGWLTVVSNTTPTHIIYVVQKEVVEPEIPENNEEETTEPEV